MSILIGELEFEGPYYRFHELNRKPGIYAVLSIADDNEVELVELAETEDVKEQSHKRSHFWQEHIGGLLSVAVHYTPCMSQKVRRAIKDALMAEFDPVLCLKQGEFQELDVMEIYQPTDAACQSGSSC